MRKGTIVAYNPEMQSGYIRDMNNQKIKFRSSITFHRGQKVCFEIAFLDDQLMATHVKLYATPEVGHKESNNLCK